jgi:hypothetical protein
MRPNRVRTWRELFAEMFLRGGLFSLRPLPKTDAERELESEQVKPLPEDATRLNLRSSGE